MTTWRSTDIGDGFVVEKRDLGDRWQIQIKHYAPDGTVRSVGMGEVMTDVYACLPKGDE